MLLFQCVQHPVVEGEEGEGLAYGGQRPSGGQEGADPGVSGHCRFAADAVSGEFTLRTVKPGPVPHRAGGQQAPHISLWIVARGINIGLQTRIYFEDEDNSADPLLARIEQRPRVETLIAKKLGPGQYRFDIRLQGAGETVFLDL